MAQPDDVTIDDMLFGHPDPEGLPLPHLLFQEEPGHYRMTLGAEDWSGWTFEVELSVCPDLLCPCGDLTFDCTPLAWPEGSSPGSEPWWFVLDTNERRLAVSEGGDRPRGERLLGRAFVEALDGAGWMTLRAYVMEVRRRDTEALDVTELEAEFPDEVLVNGQSPVGFTEILPHGILASFRIGDDAWQVDDSYCVDPKCECVEAHLAFLRIAHEGRRAAELEDDEIPRIRYAYRTGKVEEVLTAPKDGMPTLDEFLEATRALVPFLDQDLEIRHKQLRNLYLRDLLRVLEAHEAAKSKKVGRNDPCPCGSGKKYKRCCGA